MNFNRSHFTDWRADHETRDRKLVNLDWLNYSSAAFAQHPLPFQALRWCVGLMRTGGILFNHPDSRVRSYFVADEPLAVGGQWLVSRGVLSDWTGDRRTKQGQLASLEQQMEGLGAHPLPFGMLRNVVGLTRLGGVSYPDTYSRTTIATAEDDLLLDSLSTEELDVLITEDTGEPLGLG